MAANQSRVGLRHVTVVPTNYDPDADEVVVDADDGSDTPRSGRKST